MPCIILILVLAFPRVVLAALFFFTNYIERAYHGYLLPLLGFIFLPITTITYAWIVNSHSQVEGIYLIILIIAVLLDAGSFGSSRWRRRD